MAVVTFSLFGFDTLPSRLWAFSQMGLAKRYLRAIPGLRFFKLMGTGAGAGFSTWPNFGVYALLCEWESIEEARQRLATAPIVGRYKKKCARTATLYLSPVTSRGSWGRHSFDCARDSQALRTPIVALTRASIRPAALAQFWHRVPAISHAIGQQAARRFMIGTGEVPWLHQVTVSVWDDIEAMEQFSLKSKAHGEAVSRAYREGWFSEYCFTRFNLLDVEGAWAGLELVRPSTGSVLHQDEMTPSSAKTPEAFRLAAE
jgi:spheroidene monooxygenase